MGGAFRRCEGRLGSGAPPLPPTCCRRRCADVGAQHCPLGWHPLWGLRAAGVVGAVPGGVACHRCEGASGVRRCPSAGRPSPGESSRGSATRVCRVRSARAWVPSTVPTACALAGRRCALRGWRKGVPGWAAFCRWQGRLRSVTPPHLIARPPGGLLGSARHVLWARVCGSGGPSLSTWLASPVGAIRAVGLAEGRLRGGCPSPS